MCAFFKGRSVQAEFGQTSVQATVLERFFPVGFETDAFEPGSVPEIDVGCRARAVAFEMVPEALEPWRQIFVFAQADAIGRIADDGRSRHVEARKEVVAPDDGLVPSGQAAKVRAGRIRRDRVSRKGRSKP